MSSGKGLSRVLVPVNGSALDDDIVSLACEMVDHKKGTVWVLYVIEVARTLPLDAEVPIQTAHGEQVLQHLEALGKSKKCQLDGEILQARNAGPAIVQEAVDRDAELLIAGVDYQEHYGSPTLGELVPYLLKRSPCRVLVYRGAQPAPVPA